MDGLSEALWLNEMSLDLHLLDRPTEGPQCLCVKTAQWCSAVTDRRFQKWLSYKSSQNRVSVFSVIWEHGLKSAQSLNLQGTQPADNSQSQKQRDKKKKSSPSIHMCDWMTWCSYRVLQTQSFRRNEGSCSLEWHAFIFKMLHQQSLVKSISKWQLIA